MKKSDDYNETSNFQFSISLRTKQKSQIFAFGFHLIQNFTVNKHVYEVIVCRLVSLKIQHSSRQPVPQGI